VLAAHCIMNPVPPTSEPPADEPAPEFRPSPSSSAGEAPAQLAARREMVERQLVARGIKDPRVLEAMLRVPRHAFVPPYLQEEAYADYPLPIGWQQTISQPYIVALMTELAQPLPTDRALDIGTGSGYQAAILSQLVKQVYSLELHPKLAAAARQRLCGLGYANVEVQVGNGYQGWPEHAPYDLIVVAAAPPRVPSALIEQLASGGRLVLPVGESYQELTVVEKTADGQLRYTQRAPVMFVPLTDPAG
jgi:protein-L-isoaspartate(D-aspartate) O-methyltransferase